MTRAKDTPQKWHLQSRPFLNCGRARCVRRLCGDGNTRTEKQNDHCEARVHPRRPVAAQARRRSPAVPRREDGCLHSRAVRREHQRESRRHLARRSGRRRGTAVHGRRGRGFGASLVARRQPTGIRLDSPRRQAPGIRDSSVRRGAAQDHFGAGRRLGPIWSPDGTQLAYTQIVPSDRQSVPLD